MSRADYAHWNEDADYMWWHEEGKHVEEYEPPEPGDDPELDAEYAFAEECAERDDSELHELLADRDYIARWPRAKRVIEFELRERGLTV